MSRNCPLLEQIRHATQATHQRLEALVDIESSTGTELAYGELLARLYGLYHPLETQLGRLDLASFGYELGRRTKVLALVRDLEALGWRNPRIDAIAHCPDAPRLRSAGQGLGCAYVVEGATLGGQVITRLIRRRSPRLPTHFFDIYGDDTRELWNGFLGSLRAYEESGAAPGEAVRGAAETFSAFERWLK